MNLRIVIPLLFFASSALFSQENITVNGKSYSATTPWNFICEHYAFSETQVQVAKAEKGGLLKLAVTTSKPSFAIAGTVYVDLADMTTIVCTDKNTREVAGNQIVSYYTFSAAEMERLKKSEIQTVRFAIKGKQDKFASQTGHFTAVNKKSFFSTAYNTDKKSYDTLEAVKLLYAH